VSISERAVRVFDDPNYVLIEDRTTEDGETRWRAIGLVGAVLLLVVHAYKGERMKKKKKSSASSRPEKLVSVRAEDVFNKPLTRKQKADLDRLAKMPDSEIDYSGIPPLTDEQLAQFRRPAKVLVAARLDRDVYDWLQQYGEGYSTRINLILREVMQRSRVR
jgi:uncharacterized protein (DUF4415 family)